MRYFSYLLILLIFSFFSSTALAGKTLSKSNSQFIAFLAPKITLANKKVTAIRERLLSLHHNVLRKTALTSQDKAWLTKVETDYKITSKNNAVDWDQLLKRVDTLPTSLVLAQAANESAWGTSRFAKQGNNYFGQWCYKSGCGIVPLRRPWGATYEVQKFASADNAIQSYMRNLNSSKTYQRLRDIRAQLRHAHQPVTGIALAAGLGGYSQRGDGYISIIRSMIRDYDLAVYD